MYIINIFLLFPYIILYSKIFFRRLQIFLLFRTRLAVMNHRRKRSLLTVKDSVGDSGRGSGRSSSLVDRRRLVTGPAPATPSDTDTVEAGPGTEQFGSFYHRLGSVCE